MSTDKEKLLAEREIILEELERHGAYASTTSGVSMRPLFKTHRDVVILEKPKSPPKKYDVVLYPSKTGKFLLHRIIGESRGGEEYLIRGDNTYHIERVAKSEIVAVLTAFNRKGKHRTVNGRGYKIYSRVWNFIYPLRFTAFKLRAVLSKIKRGILRR